MDCDWRLGVRINDLDWGGGLGLGLGPIGPEKV